jgi:hypothetical protein
MEHAWQQPDNGDSQRWNDSTESGLKARGIQRHSNAERQEHEADCNPRKSNRHEISVSSETAVFRMVAIHASP